MRICWKYVKNEYYPEGEAPEKSIDVELAIKLKTENKAFKVEKYKHSYPNCWRTDKPILYYPLDSWFIKVTDVKDRMHSLNKTINWKPESTGTVVLETGWQMQMIGIYLVLVIGEFPYQSGEQKMVKKKFVLVL